MTQHIHWHEGLFLQPHHLQMMQRNLLDQADSERRLKWAYPYGVIEYDLSEDALRNKLVQFKHLRAIMPSGLEVDFPSSADLPPLNIQDAFAGDAERISVLLGVPRWDPNEPNAITGEDEDGWQSRRVYKLKEIERPDENTGVHTQPIMVRRINARLLFEHEDTAGLEVIPIARIVRSTIGSAGLPIPDPDFMPPCLLLHGFPPLLAVIQDLANQVDANRHDLMDRILRGGVKAETMRDAKFQYEHVFFMKTLNRYSARFACLLTAPSITAFEIYLELRDLLGELGALAPGYDVLAVAHYDHHDPVGAFGDVVEKIRALLSLISSQRFRKVEFVHTDDILTADLRSLNIQESSRCFLGVETQSDPRLLAKLVEDPDRFKIMARSNIRQRIRGLDLKEEREIPLDLPAQVGLHYFRIRPLGNLALWRRILVEESMAIRFTEMESAEYSFSLYVTSMERGDQS